MKLPDDLYTYQKEDVDRMLSDDTSWLLLNEMGTGKTPTSLAVSELGNFKGKTLIVCPKTLQLEWSRQIQDWCGFEPSIARKSSVRKLQTLFDEFYSGEINPFFITNYETFRVKRHTDILNGYPFGLVILDEAHTIRNLRTKQTKGLLEFLSTLNGVKVIALTGSPIVNNPVDLHTLLCVVRPETYNSRTKQAFIDRYCFSTRSRGGRVKIHGLRDPQGLRDRTGPYTIRRTKEEVLSFLPEKYYRRVILEMEEDQRELYTKMKQDLMILLDTGEPIWAPSVLAELTRLRQINLDPRILGSLASSSKTNFLLNLMQEDFGIGENEDSEKLVVFSCFKTYIDHLSGILWKRDINHVKLTGAVSMEDRAKAVDSFQKDKNVKVVLGTVKTMGVGLTLTSASNCIFMDRWWNPAINSQCADRLHRIGQKNAVQIILPINEKSIDTSLDTILAGKEKVSMQYLGDDKIMREVVEDMRREAILEDEANITWV